MFDVTMSVHAGDFQVIIDGVVIHTDGSTHMIWLSTPEGVACVPMAMVTSIKNEDDMWFSASWAGVVYPSHEPEENPFVMNPDTVPDVILEAHNKTQEGHKVKVEAPATYWSKVLASKVAPVYTIGAIKD